MQASDSRPRSSAGRRILDGGLDDARVVALIEFHLRTARAHTACGSDHGLSAMHLRAPDVTFWSLWDGEELLGIGALREISPDHGEIKSMHVAPSGRRSGAGSALLRHILEKAREKGMRRVSLETGSWDYFRPAQALYRKHGFSECPPFAEYQPDPNSFFMSLDLQPPSDSSKKI
jgi:putative acetyltransferase